MKQRAIRGKFMPANQHKYEGKIDRITYRSLWERKVMLYCDRSDQVVKWSSEELHIPYLNPRDNRYHNYYPDFALTMRDGKRIIVEVKPAFQKFNPVNQQKFLSAQAWCKENDHEFIVLTEKEIKP